VVPLVVKELELMIEEVAVDPPRLLVIVFTEEVRLLFVVKLVTERLVVVALVAVKLVKKPVTVFSKVVKS
jgi:hypothetical protein